MSHCRKITINGSGHYKVFRGGRYLKLNGSIKTFTAAAVAEDGSPGPDIKAAVVTEINAADSIDISGLSAAEQTVFDKTVELFG